MTIAILILIYLLGAAFVIKIMIDANNTSACWIVAVLWPLLIWFVLFNYFIEMENTSDEKM